MSVLVPLNVLPGQIVVTKGLNSSHAVDDFIVGNRVVVPEVEPNDNPSGSDATKEMGNREVSGLLSSPSDVDYYYLQHLVEGKRYRVRVSPRIVDSILVRGQVQSLDQNGEVRVTPFAGPMPPNSQSVFLGITGATGSYTMTFTLVP